MLGLLTESATDVEVASRAAMITMTHRLRKAAMKRRPGWSFSCAGCGLCSRVLDSSGGGGGVPVWGVMSIDGGTVVAMEFYDQMGMMKI